LAGVLGHADRAAPLKAYCTGLILPGERKSLEPIAARVDPARVQAAHQSLHHFVAKADWSDEALLAVVRAEVLPAIERHGPIQAWIVDDTSLPKKGRHSVGVARQYCGQRGKQDNCQVAVTLSLATVQASLTALAAGVAQGVVLADAGYGVDTAFRTTLSELGLVYIVGIQSSTSLWPPGSAPLAPKPWSGRGRPPTRVRRNPDHTPLSALDLAKRLPAQAWQAVTWRQGTNAPLTSRFAAVRVQPAHRDHLLHQPRPEEWLLIEWPEGEQEPTKYWLSSLAPDTALADLVEGAKLRWRIERDYQDLKQEIGLGHYEGRGWRGFHHHAALCIAAYGFLVSERGRIPPSGPERSLLSAPRLPNGYRPRGASDQAGASR